MGLQKYLKFGNKVLSFDAIWRDENFDNEINHYKINYYLAGDQVEVKEMHCLNNGKSPFPLFLKKTKLPKNFSMVHCPGLL